MGKVSKYRNVRTEGFASKKEAARYKELLLLEKAGEISDIHTQVRFKLDVNNEHICDYVADFTYLKRDARWRTVEDCKGFKTPIYRIKKKLMKAVYGIEITET
jgi:hypothetical protein